MAKAGGSIVLVHQLSIQETLAMMGVQHQLHFSFKRRYPPAQQVGHRSDERQIAEAHCEPHPVQVVARSASQAVVEDGTQADEEG